jgi:Zn-dependent alcohol dehydrogenase
MARAVRFDRYGDREVVYVADVAVPEPAVGEVVVEVRAAGIKSGRGGDSERRARGEFPVDVPIG